MQIDWFTVGAQVLNFLVLVYLLKRFLYGPIVDAMSRREQRVTERLREAEESQRDAERREAEFRREQDELEAHRKERLEEARAEAEARRKELVDDARREVDAQRDRWRAEMVRERESFVRTLRSEAAEWITRAARAAFRELADAELEERVVGVFQDRLRKLEGDERDRLVAVLRDADEPVSIVTAFELAEAQRDALRETIGQVVGERVTLRFEESPELVCGIELRTAGVVLSWNLDAFVDDVAEEVGQALQQAAGGEADAGPGAAPDPDGGSAAGAGDREAADG